MDNYIDSNGFRFKSKYSNTVTKPKKGFTEADYLPLVEKGIYILHEEHKNVLLPEEHKNPFIGFLSKYIWINRQAYVLSNDVIDDLYMFLKYYYEFFTYTPEGKEMILVELERYLTKEDKISFLKEKHKEIFKEIEDDIYYLDFSKGFDTGDFSEWKDTVTSTFNNPDLITMYLTSDINIYFKKGLIDEEEIRWNVFYDVKTKSDFIKQKIQELESENISSEFSFEPEKPSIPKSIAMLYVSGFFDTDKIKKLSSVDLYKVVAVIIGKNPDNSSDIRSIKGNINVLNPNSEENSLKYTSFKHVEKFMKIVSK